MAKRKLYYKKPNPLTFEQVLEECEDYRQVCKADGNEWWFNHQGEFFGYQYYYQYVKLDCGWVQAPEMVCEYCIHSVVNNFGTEKERLAFNAMAPLGPDYTCWITNKDYATKRARQIRRSREYTRSYNRSMRDYRQKRELVFVEA